MRQTKEEILHNNILYTCLHHNKYGNEQIVMEHAFTFILSGKIKFQTNELIGIYGAGSIALIRKNELVKTLKLPDENGLPFKSISIFLKQQFLRNYAAERSIPEQETYTGKNLVEFSKNPFIKAYFDSLIPYFNQPSKLSPSMTELKTKEAVELILGVNEGYKNFLFDFTEPFKIDLEMYMNKNFTFDIPIKEFARLSGRSLSTFKRDFKKIFNTTPEYWLREKRLDVAHFLISEKKQKPSDTFMQVGFKNFSHFSYSFKEKFGYKASSLK